MSTGLLIIRLAIGLTLAAHGAQKLFGIFGGAGPDGTATFFAGLGYRAPHLMVYVAGFASFVGGLALAAGLLTPFAALGIATLMVNAIVTVQWKHGYWARQGGYESNLLIWAVAVGLAATGPGAYSLDAALGTDSLNGAGWGAAVAVASVVVAALTLTVGRDRVPEGAPR